MSHQIELGAAAINHYVGKGPFLIVRPDPAADKFAALTVVATDGTWLIREGDHTAGPVPTFPPAASLLDGSGVLALDAKETLGPRTWRLLGYKQATAWGSGNKAVLTAVWNS